MIAAIHQPHYFPWLGYFDKVAKADRFVIMDKVQYVPRSYMSRNSFVCRQGSVEQLTVTVSKHGYQSKTIADIEIVDCKNWQNKHLTFFKNNYRYFPHFDEVMSCIEPVLVNNYSSLFDLLVSSIYCVAGALKITTEFVLQSTLPLSETTLELHNGAVLDELEQKRLRRCKDVIDICLAAKADHYITGKGKSLEFIDESMFRAAHIALAYQNYVCPVYEQKFTEEFVPNISVLDFLFNCGIEQAKEIFWTNVKTSNEVYV